MLRNVRRARLPGRDGLWDLHFEAGRISALRPHDEAQALTARESDAEAVSLDAQGRLVTPPFVEPHVHLDAVLTAGQPAFNRSGTLFEGIQRWSERKATLSLEDVKERARRALQWQIAQGIQFVRTHCDVTDPSLVALRALLELKAEFSDRLSLQLVAFPQEGIVSFPRGHELMEEALRLGADVVGAIPHFEFTRDDGVASLKLAFDLAERFDRLLDIHCDEIDDEQSRFLEVVAAHAHHRGLGARTTASHTTAMGSYNDAYAYKLFRLLGLSGMNFIANPLVNIHLQGRFDSYPKRRGVTRVKELLQAGLNVCFGHDDIVDPWYPLGTGNMLQVLHMGLHVCQLMGHDDLSDCLKLITSHSARTLALGDGYGIEEGRPANMLVLDARSEYEAVRRQCIVLNSIREGRVIAGGSPATHWVSDGGAQLAVDFQHDP
jgi:cytosine/creatinine deaminase